MPTVTVVIPTYNRAEVLPRAVDSVLAQSYEDFELLVVDDGSTDRTAAALAAYDDPRLRVVTHGDNRGANAARNTGIAEASGEYVAFLDSDDSWAPEKLERQLDRLLAAGDDAVAVYCDFELDVPGGSGRLRSAAASVLARFDDDVPAEGGEELAAEILADRLHSGAGSTLLVETAVARRIDGFDERLDRFQDPEFLLRVVQKGRLCYVDEPLVTRHDTGSPAPETIERSDSYLLSKHRSLVEDLAAEGYAIESAHALVVAKEYLQVGEVPDGLRHLSRADVPARHWPGVLWSLAVGVRRRSPRRAVAAALLVVGLAALLARR
ncbi:MAG: glycosyltransferase family 2 protein [Haloarculaceae archaeon]